MTKIVFLLFLFSPLFAYSQFYDEVDELQFYVDKDQHVKIFNFDGNSGTNIPVNGVREGYWTEDHGDTPLIKRALKRDPNCYEKLVYSTPYELEYSPDESTSSTIVYTQYVSGFFTSYTQYFYFSKDRETLEIRDSKHYNKYRRVPKSYFMQSEGRKPKAESGVIYE